MLSPRLQRSRVTCQNLYVVSQSLSYGSIGIRTGTKSHWVDRVAVMNLDTMKPETAAARPGFKSSTNANRNNRNTEFVSQDGCPFPEFGNTSVNRTRTFGEDQENPVVL